MCNRLVNGFRFLVVAGLFLAGCRVGLGAACIEGEFSYSVSVGSRKFYLGDFRSEKSRKSLADAMIKACGQLQQLVQKTKKKWIEFRSNYADEYFVYYGEDTIRFSLPSTLPQDVSETFVRLIRFGEIAVVNSDSAIRIATSGLLFSPESVDSDTFEMFLKQIPALAAKAKTLTKIDSWIGGPHFFPVIEFSDNEGPEKSVSSGLGYIAFRKVKFTFNIRENFPSQTAKFMSLRDIEDPF